MKKIFILTGEPSGDKLASKVISKLQKNDPKMWLQKCFKAGFKTCDTKHDPKYCDRKSELIQEIWSKKFELNIKEKDISSRFLLVVIDIISLIFKIGTHHTYGYHIPSSFKVIL